VVLSTERAAPAPRSEEMARHLVFVGARIRARHSDPLIASRSSAPPVAFAVPVTKSDPPAPRVLRFCCPRQRAARMVESDFMARRKQLFEQKYRPGIPPVRPLHPAARWSHDRNLHALRYALRQALVAVSTVVKAPHDELPPVTLVSGFFPPRAVHRFRMGGDRRGIRPDRTHLSSFSSCVGWIVNPRGLCRVLNPACSTASRVIAVGFAVLLAGICGAAIDRLVASPLPDCAGRGRSATWRRSAPRSAS
jgi:hypothetical protein